MKNLKKIIASFAAAAVAATGMFSAIPASAEMVETTLEYNGPSDGAMTTADDGTSLRLNIVNEWIDNPVKDMATTGSFNEKIAVNFTVEGLGDATGNVDEAGEVTPFTANLAGLVGTNVYWSEGNPDNTVEVEPITITGDGAYTVELPLTDGSNSLSCLILESNINVFQFSETGSVADCGVTFSVDSITTMADDSVVAGTLTTAFIAGNIGAENVWAPDEAPAGSTVANIDGDAKYMVEWVCGEGGGSEGIEFLVVQMDGFTSDMYPDLKITVNEVYVDGAPVAGYKTSADAVDLAFYEKPAGASRIYLIDRWVGTGIADLAADTTITQSIKVVFTVSGTGVEGTSNVPAAGDVELGDATLDGKINLYDAIEIAKYMMGEALTDEQLTYADITQDGKVNLYDAIAVCNIIMG